MFPGLWFELFGANRSGRGTQLPNHPCAYLLPDWPEEESHWLPVCIIQPLPPPAASSSSRAPLSPHSSYKKKKKHTLLTTSVHQKLPRFLLLSVSLKITFSLFLVKQFEIYPGKPPRLFSSVFSFFLLLFLLWCQWLKQVPKHLWSILHRLIVDCMFWKIKTSGCE